ncbi:MAG: hypothetical protein RIS64_1835 [Bacteroidota bacterium]
MKAKVYHFDLQLNWRLLNHISQIDRFDASWSSMEKKEGASLKQLKTVATIQSIGALTTLCLLKSGYQWIEYVSFEHEIEQNKKKYYQVLRSCQAQRPNEDITEWIDFFVGSLINMQKKLQHKLESASQAVPVLARPVKVLSTKEKSIYAYISQHPNCQSKDLTDTLKIPKSTVKRILSELVATNFVIPIGKGARISYMKV